MNEVELKRQFDRVKQSGWLSYFQGTGFQPEILLGIASRETNIKNILGDGGHGHGIMQIDDRSFPLWCRSNRWTIPKEAIDMGVRVLKEKLESVRLSGVEESNALRVAIASYNCGPIAIRNFLVYGNPDLSTTGKDYSKDVLQRAAIFKRFLKHEQYPESPSPRIIPVSQHNGWLASMARFLLP